METIFKNSLGASAAPVFDDDSVEAYVYKVHMLIDDAVDYEESELSYDREELTKYYYGMEPALPVEEDEDPEDLQQSSIVSTDVRDTVLSIMPSLMRIFASSEHVVNFMPRNRNEVDMAKDQTDYIRYKFWDENQGFMTLYSAIKDCLTVRLGVVTWWTDNSYEVQEQRFQKIYMDQLAFLVEQAAGLDPQIVYMTPPTPEGMVEDVVIRFFKSTPSLKVAPVPPEEFRISRNAKDVKSADCVGWERIERASTVIAKGFDPEMVHHYTGETIGFSEERQLRNPGIDMSGGSVLNDGVLFGEYYVRVDEDGDGVNELHRITTIGSQRDIIDDYIVPRANFALFQADPRPHTAIGDSPASLVMELQKIKTNILRASLDSLADTLNPRTAINEMVTNVEDAMSSERGAVIRTRGNPSEAVHQLNNAFVGAHGFDMLAYLDNIRQQRTGITEASKGLDPKVFQSTNDIGIDFVVSGAQERIELIARIIAETGVRDLFIGMLNEVIDNPNEEEEIMVKGEFRRVQPSLFDAGMRCVVNPTLGKGSDVIRLQALEKILALQERAIEKFGIGNGVVGIGEMNNTIADMLALINIKNPDRYFRPITPEQVEAIENAPKEPDPATLLAQAELEKVKKDVVVTQAELDQKDMQMRLDDDFRRDKLNVDSYLDLLDIAVDLRSSLNEVRAMNEPPRT